MTPDLLALGAFVAGAAVAWALARAEAANPPEWALRTNVSGKQVPAVLGVPLAAGALAPLAAAAVLVAAGGEDLSTPRLRAAAAVVVAVMAAAGAWDDRRGDESARGFAGHLSAGRLTGGVVKIVAGGAAGVAAGFLVYPGDGKTIALTAAAVPLTANLLNLLDRAPGRAAKAAFALGIPLVLLGDDLWRNAAASAFGALAAVFPADVRERAMLGDAGANPVGALLGLGLAVSLGPGALTVAVAVLLLLNLASEKVSFSKVIERTPPLRALDSIGRK